jgi:hypothetical protein
MGVTVEQHHAFVDVEAGAGPGEMVGLRSSGRLLNALRSSTSGLMYSMNIPSSATTLRKNSRSLWSSIRCRARPAQRGSMSMPTRCVPRPKYERHMSSDPPWNASISLIRGDLPRNSAKGHTYSSKYCWYLWIRRSRRHARKPSPTPVISLAPARRYRSAGFSSACCGA